MNEEELKQIIISLLNLIDELIPDGESNSIKTRKMYLKAKEIKNSPRKETECNPSA